MNQKKIVLPGGAGLVGQNLIVRLKESGYTNLVVLDKHRANLKKLKALHPELQAEHADLAEPGDWQQHFTNADIVVMLQAQIGGLYYDEFVRNNVDSTRLIVDLIKANNIPQVIYISSSVVESVADDFYTRSKTLQEKLMLDSGIACPVLRPTLMYGWFDRKHLGWLSRFIQKMPVFPIPGHGRYMRQPLYVGDFCNIIISCIENNINSGVYNISGHEKINYVDIIKEIKQVTNAKTLIAHLPYPVFYSLLWLWGLFDKNPPFTTQQLSALTAKDEFEVIDWPAIFNVKSTPFHEAIKETFTHPLYSNVMLEF